MDRNPGPTGIEGLEGLPWGTHFCLFYETKQDLLETLLGYFKAGLKNHEFCLWITSEPVIEGARNALRQAIPGADHYLEAGDIEILTYRQWYFTADAFNAPKAIENWNAKLSQSVEKGYARIRAAGEVAWLDQEGWHAFSNYERELDEQVSNNNLLVVCAYPMNGRSASEVLDIARTHEYVAAKRHGNWEILETPALKQTKVEAEKFEAKLAEQADEQKNSGPFRRHEPSAILRYGLPVLAVIISLASTYLLQPFVFRTPLFFLAIMISTWVGGLGPGLLAVLLSTLAINLFLSPAGILETSFQNIPNVISFLIAALLVSSWSEVRRRAEYAVGKARDELEDKVKERTANLSRSNQALQSEIVERTQAEKALWESETKLKEAEQLAHIGYWDRDLITDLITGSEGAYRIFGVKPEEHVLNQAKLLEMIHPDDRQIQQQALKDALQGSRIYDVEYRIIRPDGDVRYVHVRDEIEYNVSGQPVRIFGALQDITERKQAENEIRRNAARAQLLADISQSCDQAGLDYQRVLHTISQRTAELIGDACMILELSEDRKRLRPAAFHHPNPEALAVMREILTNAWTGSLDAQISKQLLAGDPVWIPVLTPEEIRESIPAEFWPYIDRFGHSSLLAVPLRVQGQVIGLLSLARDRSGSPYTQGDQVLVQEIADRAALTIENARLFQAVSEQRERLRALGARLVEAQETERRSIARELHDEVGQMLTGLQITLKMSSRLTSDAAHKSLIEAQKLVEQLLDRVQALSLDLRPAVLDDLGLVPALLWQFERYTRQTGIRVRFDHLGIYQRFPTEIETAAYRIIQEGLTNVARHANVPEAVVRVWAEDGALGLQIEDKGEGFVVNSTQETHASTGLSGMEEQAELLGGQVTIESAPGAGTLITVELPLPVSLERGQSEPDDISGG